MALTGIMAVAGVAVGAEPTVIAKEGKTEFTIVESARATEPEKHAAKELAEFLARVTGATFPVIAESGFTGKTPAIYVGWTDYAAKNGIDAAKLGEEEWVIRTVDDNLILYGGRPRGTLYAVYEFLERQIGCHWLDKDTEIVPSRPQLSIGKLDVKGKPFFRWREVAALAGTDKEQWQFLLRNKNYRFHISSREPLNFPPAGAFYRLDGYPLAIHSFSYFVNAKDWFATHPEYFSMDSGGKRIGESELGQPCLTNPDVRRLTKAKLREFIAKDRAEADKKACPYPKVYAINQNDIYDAHCKCLVCRAIVEKEGSESGPLIDFINEIAEDIEKDYPDILVSTLAYNLTSVPPKTIKPRKNVIIGWCDVYTVSDILRPLSDPLNSRNYRELAKWSKVAPRLAIADDYWTPFGYYENFPSPYSMIQCIGPDIRYFADCHAEGFYSEAYEYIEAGEHFTQLKFWLAYQLLANPYQPAEPLIKTFMDGYYGKASPAMQGYMNYLHKRIIGESVPQVLRDAPHKLKYLDINFFINAKKFFDEAESQIKTGTPESQHIRKERLVLDGALLFMWPWLERKLPEGRKMPFDHEAVLKRYDAEWHGLNNYSQFYSKESKVYSQEGKLREKVVALLKDPKLPEPFNRFPAADVADFNWLTFSQKTPSIRFVDDQDAAGGIAAEPAAMSAIQAAEKGGGKSIGGSFLNKPLCFGVSNGPTVTVKQEDIPQDGKYHLYKIGRITVRQGTTVWALDGKRLGVNVDRLFVPDSTKTDDNDWVAHISLKVQGLAHVKGSTAPNGVWMDRVLLVRPGRDDKIDPAEVKRREEMKRRLELRPKVQAGRCAEAAGDPAKVDWNKAVEMKGWATLKGEATPRKLEGRVARDGTHLYVRLTEAMDTVKLVISPNVFSADDWELLFAANRGEPAFRQLAVNPDGVWKALARGEGENWTQGVKILSKTDAQAWIVSIAIPLDRLMPNGVKAGQPVYLNVMRGGSQPLVWSPTYEGGFRLTEWMGELALE